MKLASAKLVIDPSGLELSILTGKAAQGQENKMVFLTEVLYLRIPGTESGTFCITLGIVKTLT